MDWWGRAARALGVTIAVAVAASACSVSGAQPRVLTWYIDDPNLNAQPMADACDLGKTNVKVRQLPSGPDRAYAALVRRLQADPASVDLLTVDSALVPELASAGFLRPVPAVNRSDVSRDVLPAALAQLTVNDDLYAVPWLFDPQLLWYRPVTAERAGLDMSKPLTWEKLIAGAARINTTIGLDDARGTGLAQWLEALIASAGGSIVRSTDNQTVPTLSSQASRTAAGVIEAYSAAKVGPGPSASAVESFGDTSGGFLIAPASVWSDPAIAALSDAVAVAPYPRVGGKQVTVGTGQALAVSDASTQVAEARTLIECLTSEKSLAAAAASGYGPARTSLLKAEAVESRIEIAADIARSDEKAITLPVSTQWNVVRRSLDASWLPIASVTQVTPAEAQQAATAALKGQLR